MSVTMTVRLESGLKQRLERLSEATQRSKSFLPPKPFGTLSTLTSGRFRRSRKRSPRPTGVNSPATKSLARCSASGESVQVSWLARALRNLDDEAEFVAQDNPAAAQALVQRVHGAIGHLKANPALGRPGRIHGQGNWSCPVPATSSHTVSDLSPTALRSCASFTPHDVRRTAGNTALRTQYLAPEASNPGALFGEGVAGNDAAAVDQCQFVALPRRLR